MRWNIKKNRLSINRHVDFVYNPCCTNGRGCFFIHTTTIKEQKMDIYDKLKILEDVESQTEFDESKVKNRDGWKNVL